MVTSLQPEAGYCSILLFVYFYQRELKLLEFHLIIQSTFNYTILDKNIIGI